MALFIGMEIPRRRFVNWTIFFENKFIIIWILDIAAGTSMDWVKGILGTRFAYTYEFRDLGKYGFILPPDQIIPNAEEVFDSLKVLVEETLKTRN